MTIRSPRPPCRRGRPPRPGSRPGAGWAVQSLAACTALALAAQAPPAAPQQLSITPTQGAAPGYVSDLLCSRCHPKLYTSYQEVGMARSFARPQEMRVVEDFESSAFYHAPSKRHYRMRREDDGSLWLERWQEGPDGTVRNRLEEKVDWVLGSGSTSRVYIAQSEAGELFQLPVSWYSQDGGHWGMAPGYDQPDHKGFERRVRRECMFCHNAYPEVPAGSDSPGAPQVFPSDLPQGTGCQRCHGPAGEHVRLAYGLLGTTEQIKAAILNPAKLSPRLRDDVCEECHLQPTFTLTGVRRFGRDDYSYRPGEPLPEYLVQVDIVAERPRPDRFEINHHPFRLHQSRCFLKSPEDNLSCLTCHDPHVKILEPVAKVEHFRAACLGCHGLETLSAEHRTRDDAPRGSSERSCTGCHMPRRRAQDIVHVAMTDHKIQLPPKEDLLAPLPETAPRIKGVELLQPERIPSGPMVNVYLQLALVRAGNPAALDRLEAALAKARPEALDPYLDLASGQLEAGRFAAAQATLERILSHAPHQPEAHLHLGIALSAQNRLEASLPHFAETLKRYPHHPEAHFNLAKSLARLGRMEESLPHFREAVTSRPNLVQAWVDYATTFARLGRFTDAEKTYRQALSWDPGNTTAYLQLGQVYLLSGEPREAIGWWEHGAGSSPSPGPLLEALTLLRLGAGDPAIRDPALAVKDARKAVASAEGSGAYHPLLAYAQLLAGEPQAALATLGDSQGKRTDPLDRALVEALIRDQLGQGAEARALRRKVESALAGRGSPGPLRRALLEASRKESQERGR